MNKPRPVVFIIGNPIIALVIMVLGAFAIYQWWIGVWQWPAAAIAVFGMSAAYNSNETLTEYKNWKRAWDAMGGVKGKPPLTPFIARVLGVIVTGGVWVFFAVGISSQNLHDRTNLIVFACFWLATLLLLISTVRRYRRAHPSAPRARRRRDVPVTLAIAIPKSSPDLNELRQGLPSYCRLSG